MPMKQNGLKKKNMMGGGGTMIPTAPVSSMYRKGGKSYMGGGKTMDSTMSYKDDVQKRFGGGGITDQPAMKKKNMRAGGPTMPNTGPRPTMPIAPSMIQKVKKRSVRPDPRLPRGKKGKGDI